MAENYNLGTAYGTIELNASALSRAAAGFDLLGNKMLLIGGAAVAGFGYAVKAAAGFEQQMSRFGAVGNATEGQMDKIREKALQLGRDSAYGASQVVEAFAELAYAGATTHEILSGLGDATIYLAAAGEIPLADAAKDLIVTLDQFGLKGKDAKNTANEMARAANASTASISDLVTSLRYVGTVAGPLNFQFRDVAQSLAILANEGLRGSTAGTSLRGILVGITKPSAAATEAMRQLGIITLDGSNQFFDAAGHIKSMADISEVLKKSTEGLTDKEKANAFATIFQRRAMAAALDLARGGKGAFDDLAASQQYNTTAQRIMKEKLDNLNGSIKILKASLQTFAIVLGEQFQPALKAIADTLREVTNWFIKLPGPVQKIIGSMLLFGGGGLVVAGSMAKIAAVSVRTFKGLNDVGAGFKLMGGLIRNFVSGMQLLGTTLLTNPIFLFIVALVALAVIFYLLYTRSETFRRGIQRIGEAAQAAGRWILQAFKTAWEWVKNNWPDLLLILLGPIGAAIIAWRHFKDQILSALQSVWNWIKSNWDLLTPLLLGPFGLVIIFIKRWGNDFVNLIKSAIDKAVGFINKLPYYFGYMVGFLIAGAVLLQVRLVQLFFRLWGKLLDILTNFASKALALLLNFLLGLPGMFLDTFTAVLNFVINFVEQAIAKFIELGTRTVLAIIQFFGQLPGLIFGFLTSAFLNVVNWGAQVIGSIINTGSQVIGQAVAWFSQLPGMIRGAVGDGYSLLYDWARNIITGLIDGLKSLAGKAKDIASDIGGGVIGGIKSIGHVFSPSKDMIEVGKDYMRGFIIGLGSQQATLKGLVDSAGSAVTGMNLGYPAPVGGQPPAGANYDITINNPVGETSEESLSRTMQKLAYVGIAG